MKKYLYFISAMFVFVLCFFAVPKNAFAVEDCGYKAKKQYMDEAAAVGIKTEVYEKNFYKITATNLTKNIYIEIQETGQVFIYGTDSENPSIVSIDSLLGGNKYTLKFYSTDNNCYLEVLRTKVVNLKYYNVYSEKDECKGIEEYIYCNQYLDKDVKFDGQKFANGIKNYKAKKVDKNNEKKDESKESFLTNVGNFVKEYIVIIIILVVLVVGGTVAYIILNKKKKAKKRLRGRAK